MTNVDDIVQQLEAELATTLAEKARAAYSHSISKYDRLCGKADGLQVALRLLRGDQ